MRRLLVSLLVASMVVVALPMSAAHAAPGDAWEPRNAPQGPWTSVVYGADDNLFVAVGTDKVMTSPDGITWTPRTSPAASAWSSVTYGNGTFVAVASNGVVADQVMTSPDGITWTKRTSPVASAWSSVTYGNGTFVAVASNGADTDQVMTSTDGTTWAKNTSAQANPWRSVTFGAGTFVAVSDSGTNRVMTSANGTTWAPQTAAAANPWQSVTFGSSTFLAVANSGSNRVMTSPDGVTWTPRSAATASPWAAVTSGNGLFVAVALDAVMTSVDAVTWRDRAVATNTSWRGIAWGEGVFVAVANDGANVVMTSIDGFVWTARTAPPGDWQSVTWGAGMFVAVGHDVVMTSPDGIVWTGQTPAQALDWESVTYGNGLFVAVSADGADQVMTSPDGATWTIRETPPGTWRSATYGNGTFVAVSSGPTTRVMTSPDGITWTGRTAPAANAWQSVTFGNNVFVAVASNGAAANQVMTSPDGIAWTARTSAAVNPWQSVTFGNNVFVAVSDNGTDRVMSSPNGTTWTLRGTTQVTGSNPWTSVAYGSGQFVAVASGGANNRVMASGSFVLAPTITSFEPAFGPVGTTVTIQGTNLTGATAVVFHDTEAVTFTVDNATQITAKVPTGATTGPITVFTPGGTAVSEQPFTLAASDRIFGADAIDTSIAISQAAFPNVGVTSSEVGATATDASAVVLARSDFFADALAGGPLAAQENGPLLITPGASQSNAIDPRVLTEIQRVLEPGEKVYVLGGNLALSSTIDTTLANAGFAVQRVFGQNQFGTAVAIADLIDSPAAILEATGFNFPDALSAVPAAIQLNGVILLTRDNQQASETQAFITAHPNLPRFAIGGPLVAAGADPQATAVFGQDLYATSAAVATKWFTDAAVFGVATGANFPDALSGGVFMATGGRMGAVVLVPPALPLPAPIDTYLQSLDPGTPGFVFGGPLATSDAVVTAVKAAVG